MRAAALAAASLAWACTQPVPLEAFRRSPPENAWGCWVNAYGRTQYRPPVTTYTGPSHEPRLIRGAKSLVVGAEARLRGYPGEGEGVPSLVLPGGTRIPDLDEIDFHRKVRFFDILCVSNGPTQPPARAGDGR